MRESRFLVPVSLDCRRDMSRPCLRVDNLREMSRGAKVDAQPSVVTKCFPI
jgi:hypothetical protein